MTTGDRGDKRNYRPGRVEDRAQTGLWNDCANSSVSPDASFWNPGLLEGVPTCRTGSAGLSDLQLSHMLGAWQLARASEFSTPGGLSAASRGPEDATGELW